MAQGCSFVAFPLDQHVAEYAILIYATSSQLRVLSTIWPKGVGINNAKGRQADKREIAPVVCKYKGVDQNIQAC